MEIQEKSQEISREIKNMSAEQMLERMSDMRKTLLTLEWDRKHNQIHIGMESRYNKLKEEYQALEKQLNELRSVEKDEAKEVKAESSEELVEPVEPEKVKSEEGVL